MKCGEEVLSKDSFTVYHEKYASFTETYYGNYSLADALIPIDAAKEHGELTIAKDKNAAFWVTVHVPSDTPTGTYEGNFKLTVNNAEMNIPVQVKVNNFTLPETTTGKTLFSWRYDRVGAGELDSSIEMMEYYYEFFLDYRISLQSLPVESITADEIITVLNKYYDTLTTYTILAEPGKLGGELLNYQDNAEEMILAIASISSKEKNYFDKAMLYVVDEPGLDEDEKYANTVSMIKGVNTFLDKCVQKITDDKTGRYDNFKAIKGWQESITDIPFIMPTIVKPTEWLIQNKDTERGREFLSLINTLCPTFDAWTEENTQAILDICEEFDIENLWWYGAWMPIAPSGNYHIGDKNLLDARTYSWVQIKHGIQGNLYWDAAAYTTEKPNWDQYTNVYENPWRIEGLTAGDGFLAYPGEPYGVYGAIPSVRLMSIRDGMEELEMLYALKEQYQELEADYGKDFDASEYVNSYVDKVYYDGHYFRADGEDGLDFDQLRGDLIDCLAWNNMGIGFALKESAIANNIANLSFYLSEGCKAYIDGQLQQPVAGCRYEYQLNLEDNTNLEMQIVTEDGETYEFSRFIANPALMLQSFEDSSVLENITVSEGGNAQIAETTQYSTDGTSLYAQVSGKITGDVFVDATYVPYVSIDVGVLENISKLTDVSGLDVNIYNPGDNYVVTVKIFSENTYVKVGEYTISKGANTISMYPNQLDFKGIDKADRIVFEFANSTDGTTPNKYEFYIDNVVGKN